MADEDDKKEEAGAAKKAAAPSGKNPLLTIVLILNTLVMASMAYLQFDHMKKEAAKPSLQELVRQEMKGESEEAIVDELARTQEEQGKLLNLDGFTVNLAKSDGPRRFVRVTPVLKFSKDSKESEFTARKPQIRDTIISILNSKRPEDLLKKEGKAYLKEEIKAAINSFLIDGELLDVFYVGFQIN